MMMNMRLFMKEFCKTGARALSRYSEISGEEPCTAPEYFMPAFIAISLADHVDKDGNRLAITLGMR